MGIARQSPPSPELKIFSERIQKAIDFKKIDIAVLAKESGYKVEDIRKMLAGMREPSMKKLILLAGSLGCSVDYLLGLTSEVNRTTVTDTGAIKHQSGEQGQTSGQISGKTHQFVTMIPELLESDVELLMYLAGFLIERKSKGLLRLAKAATTDPKTENLARELKGKAEFGRGSPYFCEDAFDEDELWDNDDLEEEFDDDDYFDDDDDDDDFDTFND
jgi:transcriptional regulator with XRE-family HTH domain